MGALCSEGLAKISPQVLLWCWLQACSLQGSLGPPRSALPSLSPVRGLRVCQDRPCAQLCPNSGQLLVLAEPSWGASCKLPLSRLSLLCGFGAGKCCESCQVHAAVALQHPLPSSNSLLFWSIAGTAQTSPAAPEQHHTTPQASRPVGTPRASSHAHSGCLKDGAGCRNTVASPA